MMGRKTGADEREFPACRVIHRQMPPRRRDGIGLGGRVRRSLLAVIGIGGRPDAGRKPDMAFLVHHRVVHDGLAVPDRLVAPDGGRREEIVLRGRRFGVAHRMQHFARGVALGVQNGNVIGAVLRRAVDFAIRIEARIARIGRDLVMQIGGRAAPFPSDTTILRSMPAGRTGFVAGSSPLSMRSSNRRTASARAPAPARRYRAPSALARRPLGFAASRRRSGPEFVGELLGEVAGPRRRKRMAAIAAAGLDGVQPGALAFHPPQREFILRRHLQHREPVDRRIIFGGQFGTRRRHRGQVQSLARRGSHLWRIHQAIAAHPDVVIGLRQIRDDVTARPSVTTILAYLVGRSVVSAITQTPASGAFGPATTPPRSAAPTVTPAFGCAIAGDGIATEDSAKHAAPLSSARNLFATDMRGPVFAASAQL